MSNSGDACPIESQVWTSLSAPLLQLRVMVAVLWWDRNTDNIISRLSLHNPSAILRFCWSVIVLIIWNEREIIKNFRETTLFTMQFESNFGRKLFWQAQICFIIVYLPYQGFRKGFFHAKVFGSGSPVLECHRRLQMIKLILFVSCAGSGGDRR